MRISNASAFALVAVFFVSCSVREAAKSAAASAASVDGEIVLVPRPASIRRDAGKLRWGDLAFVSAKGEGADAVARYASTRLAVSLVYTSKTIFRCGNLMGVELQVAPYEGANPESYELTVTTNGVRLVAPGAAGLFYGIQTLLQLGAGTAEWIPCLRIEDASQYAWRGLLLDCSRHFMTKEFIKETIDRLAYHKINKLHWHLTDDQGWRIEIKKYPELTKTGAWRDEYGGKKYGGYYSQDELKEIVAYATERFIEIVPEIEMPGHASAAVAAYPELSCLKKKIAVPATWGIFEDVYCAGDEHTYQFIEDVLTEVTALFPSKYIHIGGDECPKARWKQCEKCQFKIKSEKLRNEAELQSYFTRRIVKILAARGRRLVGWDEIMEGGLAEGAVVQAWRSAKAGAAAASAGHDVVMSPTSHCYFDFPYAVTDVDKVYSFDPAAGITNIEDKKHILGGECNMWTEYGAQEIVETKIYPRLCAFAEAVWSPKDGNSWPDFRARLGAHLIRLSEMGVYVLGLPVGHWSGKSVKTEWSDLELNITDVALPNASYAVTVQYESGAHGVDVERVAMVVAAKDAGVDTHPGFSGYDKRDHVYRVATGEIPAGAKVSLKLKIRGNGGNDTVGTVFMLRKIPD
ncbi:MAG: beta-N-acetylhexosaminidase [Planctomycetes bacterium]|nr:beta-N-acetylhexosaminidase [Planctomycetota bacterium]